MNQPWFNPRLNLIEAKLNDLELKYRNLQIEKLKAQQAMQGLRIGVGFLALMAVAGWTLYARLVL